MAWESVKNSEEARVFCTVLIRTAKPPSNYNTKYTSLPRVFDTPSSHSNFNPNPNSKLNSNIKNKKILYFSQAYIMACWKRLHLQFRPRWTSGRTSKSSNGRKIARMARNSTIFGPNESSRRDLFLEKFSKSRNNRKVFEKVRQILKNFSKKIFERCNLMGDVILSNTSLRVPSLYSGS